LVPKDIGGERRKVEGDRRVHRKDIDDNRVVEGL